MSLRIPPRRFRFLSRAARLLGRRNPLEILALAAIGSFGVYALFSRVLGQPLPVGLFDW